MGDYSYMDTPEIKKEMADRLNFLSQKMINFIEKSGISEYLRVSSALMEQLILDCFADIKRLKEFHEIINAQKIKMDAYLCHWILKRKPIQIIKDNNEVDIRRFAANEQFVCTLLIMSCIDEISNLESVDMNKLNTFQNHLLYHLKYRTVNPQILELMILSFKSALNLYK